MPNSCNKCFVCHSESSLLIFNITFFIILKKKKNDMALFQVHF